MKCYIQPLLTLVRRILCTTEFGRQITEKYKAARRKRAVMKARRRLQTCGWAVLRHCIEMIQQENIPAYAEYGTLLGMVRENGFIKHDDDIDFGVAPEGIAPKKLLEIAIAHGLEFSRAFFWRGQITELTFTYKNIPIDFFYTYRHTDGRIYGQAYDAFTFENGRDVAKFVVRLYKPEYKGIELLRVRELAVPVPVNKEEFLEYNYGADWRMPIEGFKGEHLKQNREYFEDEALIITREDDIKEDDIK